MNPHLIKAATKLAKTCPRLRCSKQTRGWGLRREILSLFSPKAPERRRGDWGRDNSFLACAWGVQDGAGKAGERSLNGVPAPSHTACTPVPAWVPSSHHNPTPRLGCCPQTQTHPLVILARSSSTPTARQAARVNPLTPHNGPAAIHMSQVRPLRHRARHLLKITRWQPLFPVGGLHYRSFRVYYLTEIISLRFNHDQLKTQPTSLTMVPNSDSNPQTTWLYTP